MKTLGLLLAALTAGGSAGCTKVDTFNCLQSSECLNGGVAGVCEPGNLCSFPDPNCPSGKSYGEYAGDQASQCVGDGPGTTAPTSVSDTGTGSTSNGSATGSGTSSDTTVDPTTTMTSEVTATTDPTLTTDPSTTTGPACAPLGDSCANTSCCGGPCTVCDGGTCTPLPAEAGPMVCGSACQICGADGNCAAAPPDQTCDLDCSDIVLDSQIVDTATICRGYAVEPFMSTCGDGGQCMVPDPVAAGCTPDAPTIIAECDTVCVKDASLCVPGAFGVTKADFCALDATTPNCQTTCTPDGLSSDAAGCDAAGGCQHTVTGCGVYKCDTVTSLCRTKCMNDSHCVSGKCQGAKCQ